MTRSTILWCVAFLIAIGYHFANRTVATGEPPREAAPLVTPPPAPAGENNLDLQYATTSLHLAQIDLTEALNINQRAAGAVTTAEIERRRALVWQAQAELDALHKGEFHLADANLQTAQVNLQIADAEWKRGQAISARSSTALRSTELERLQASADQARVALAQAQEISRSKSESAALAWQVSSLRQDLLRMRVQIENMRLSNGF